METTGRHLLIEYFGCAFNVLNDAAKIQSQMEAAARAAQTTILHSYFHPFKPQGVSGVVVVEESHLSIHTWPEKGYAAVDFFTCGVGHPREAHKVMMQAFEAAGCEIIYVERGLNPTRDSSNLCMRVISHTLA